MMGNRGGKEARRRKEQQAKAHDDRDATTESKHRQDHHHRREGRSAPPAATTTTPTITGEGVVSGLRLVEGVIDTSGCPSEHDTLVAWVRETLELGRAGKLDGNTYAPIPDKWKVRNQSREMIQFGTYTHSNRVESHVPVAPLPHELTAVVDKLISCGVITESERFDSCTINMYAPGQWIPPHIDNPAFARPFVTVSLCSRQQMVLGRGMVWPEGTNPNGTDGEGEVEVEVEGEGDGAAVITTSGTSARRSGEEATLELPVGSAVVVSGEAARTSTLFRTHSWQWVPSLDTVFSWQPLTINFRPCRAARERLN